MLSLVGTTETMGPGGEMLTTVVHASETMLVSAVQAEQLKCYPGFRHRHYSWYQK